MNNVCETCDKNLYSKYECLNCESSLCEYCKMRHEKRFQTHKIVKYTDINNIANKIDTYRKVISEYETVRLHQLSDRKSYDSSASAQSHSKHSSSNSKFSFDQNTCQYHNKSKEYYCINCNDTFCIICIKESVHATHEYCFNQNVSDQLKQLFGKELNNLEGVKKEIDETRINIESGMKEFLSYYNQKNHQLHNVFDNLVKIINDIYKEKKKELKTQYVNLTNKTLIDKEELIKIKSNINYFINSSKNYKEMSFNELRRNYIEFTGINQFKSTNYNTIINKVNLEINESDFKSYLANRFSSTETKLWRTLSDDITMDQLNPCSSNKKPYIDLTSDNKHSDYKDSIYQQLKQNCEFYNDDTQVIKTRQPQQLLINQYVSSDKNCSNLRHNSPDNPDIDNILFKSELIDNISNKCEVTYQVEDSIVTKSLDFNSYQMDSSLGESLRRDLKEVIIGDSKSRSDNVSDIDMNFKSELSLSELRNDDNDFKELESQMDKDLTKSQFTIYSNNDTMEKSKFSNSYQSENINSEMINSHFVYSFNNQKEENMNINLDHDVFKTSKPKLLIKKPFTDDYSSEAKEMQKNVDKVPKLNLSNLLNEIPSKNSKTTDSERFTASYYNFSSVRRNQMNLNFDTFNQASHLVKNKSEAAINNKVHKLEITKNNKNNSNGSEELNKYEKIKLNLKEEIQSYRGLFNKGNAINGGLKGLNLNGLSERNQHQPIDDITFQRIDLGCI